MVSASRRCQSVWTAIRRLLFPRHGSRFQSRVSEEELFRPSFGRWLWNEEFQLSQHTQRFNVQGLKDVAAKVLNEPGGRNVRIDKLAEGGSNKVFTASAYGRRVIVKIPDPIVPARLSTASEVATLEYLRTELDIPVPKVFAWSSTSDNPVGCEYIIMEEAGGDALNAIWPTLEIDSLINVVDEIVSLQKRMVQSSSRFSGYGSLYFVNDAISFGMHKRIPVLTANDPTRFCLGALADQDFLHPALESAGVDCGPWASAEEYLVAIADASTAKIKSQPKRPERPMSPSAPFSFPINTNSDTSSTAALELLAKYRAVAPYLIPRSAEAKRLATPVLWHRDLRSGNIFVSTDGKITRIIDWQDTAVLPLFLQGTIPPLLKVDPGCLLLELPQNLSTMLKPEKNRILRNYRQSTLLRYYLSSLRKYVPELSEIIDSDLNTEVRSLAVTFTKGSFTSVADVLLLRELLIRIERNWSDIVCTDDSHPTCPVSIGTDELSRHRIDGRRWNEFKDLLAARQIPVAHEGWVPAEDFEAQRENLRSFITDTLAWLRSEEEKQEFLGNIRSWKLTGYTIPHILDREADQ